MVIVLVCLLVGSMILGVLFRQVVAQSRTQKIEAYSLQADWLATAALDRTVIRLAADPGWSGELWLVNASDLGGGESARVQITVTPTPNRARERTVIVEAVYPAEGSLFARRTRETAIVLSKE
jgi:hypothetical protein